MIDFNYTGELRNLTGHTKRSFLKFWNYAI